MDRDGTPCVPQALCGRAAGGGLPVLPRICGAAGNGNVFSSGLDESVLVTDDFKTFSPPKIHWGKVVNNSPFKMRGKLVLLIISQGCRIGECLFPVNKLCISIHCRFHDLGYDVHSSLKERSGQ